MNYFLKDVIAIYPLETYVEFPAMSDYITPGNIEKITESGFYDESKILNRIKRKYKYSEIGTSDVSQFYDYLNQLIEENYMQYLMNLVTISEDYSIQNVDTLDLTFTHEPLVESRDLIINNDTPSNKLNIDNIKAGTSASTVTYNTTSSEKYEDTTHRSSTSALNTTQSNVEAQLKVNDMVQKALNDFVDKLGEAFSYIQNEYYGEC